MNAPGLIGRLSLGEVAGLRRWSWPVLVLLLAGCGRSTPAPGSPVGGAPQAKVNVQPTARQSLPAGFELDLRGVEPAAVDATALDTIAVCFCLDVSSSMSQRLGNQRKLQISKQALRQTFDQLADYARSHPNKKLHVALIAFGRDVRVVQPLAPFDRDRCVERVESLSTVSGTAVGSAMVAAMRELLSQPAAARAIIVMTDGESNQGPAPDAVALAIRQSANNLQAATDNVKLSLVAFDVNASVFQRVKQAGVTVVESQDRASLEQMLTSVVQEVLLEAEEGR